MKKAYKCAEIKIIEIKDDIIQTSIETHFDRGNDLPSAGQSVFNSEWERFK